MLKLLCVVLLLLAQTVVAVPAATASHFRKSRHIKAIATPSTSSSSSGTLMLSRRDEFPHNVAHSMPSASPSGSKNALYFANRGIYGANYTAQEIPADQITHLLYAFADVAQNGSVVSSDPWTDMQKPMAKGAQPDHDKHSNNAYGSIQQLYLLKKKNRSMKTLISIGGFTASQQGKFQPAISTIAGRRCFASSAVKLLADWGFDGLDIDWEYPVNREEARNFVLLLKECRQALDDYAKKNRQTYHYLLTVAAAAGPRNYNIQDLKGMDEYLDAWHLMAYDYAGAWDTESGDQSNVYPDPSNIKSTKFNTNQAVEDYIRQGVAPHKIIMGLPLYGRSFMNTDGLGKPFSGAGKGPLGQKGVYRYRDLPVDGSTVHVNNETISAYSYDAEKKQLITFDNVETANLKAKYLMSKGLGGAVFWEASGDCTGSQSLVGTMANAMGKLEDSKNMLDYPTSQYSNIRSGMSDS